MLLTNAYSPNLIDRGLLFHIQPGAESSLRPTQHLSKFFIYLFFGHARQHAGS